MPTRHDPQETGQLTERRRRFRESFGAPVRGRLRQVFNEAEQAFKIGVAVTVIGFGVDLSLDAAAQIETAPKSC